jgi:Ca2+-binding RTX toxin-like protein
MALFQILQSNGFSDTTLRPEYTIEMPGTLGTYTNGSSLERVALLLVGSNVQVIGGTAPYGTGFAPGGVVNEIQVFWYSHDLLGGSFYAGNISGLSINPNAFLSRPTSTWMSFVLSGNDTATTPSEPIGGFFFPFFQTFTYGGNDRLIGGALIDYQYGGTGNDTLLGNAGNDFLYGEAGNDTLNGGLGNDWVTGGAGVDRMAGGAGVDRFDFNSIAETGVAASTWDHILDFKSSGADKIDLSTIDAASLLAGNNAFAWKGAGAFTTSAAGELRYKKFDLAGTVNDYTIVYGDTDRDAAAEFSIRLNGLKTLVAGDFIL